jgi:hypothetical protein
MFILPKKAGNREGRLSAGVEAARVTYSVFALCRPLNHCFD